MAKERTHEEWLFCEIGCSINSMDETIKINVIIYYGYLWLLKTKNSANLATYRDVTSYKYYNCNIFVANSEMLQVLSQEVQKFLKFIQIPHSVSSRDKL